MAIFADSALLGDTRTGTRFDASESLKRARELDADRRSQLFAAVVCASLPHENPAGTSTQTDYAVAFWLVCFVYLLIKVAGTSPQRRRFDLIALGVLVLDGDPVSAIFRFGTNVPGDPMLAPARYRLVGRRSP